MSKHKIIIDTDPGVDDAMAILYACLDPEVELVGLTSIFGNVTIDVAKLPLGYLASLLDASELSGSQRAMISMRFSVYSTRQTSVSASRVML